jgi:hypothetical protein
VIRYHTYTYVVEPTSSQGYIQSLTLFGRRAIHSLQPWPTMGYNQSSSSTKNSSDDASCRLHILFRSDNSGDTDTTGSTVHSTALYIVPLHALYSFCGTKPPTRSKRTQERKNYNHRSDIIKEHDHYVPCQACLAGHHPWNAHHGLLVDFFVLSLISFMGMNASYSDVIRGRGHRHPEKGACGIVSAVFQDPGSTPTKSKR